MALTVEFEASTPPRGSRRHSLSAPRPPTSSVEASATGAVRELDRGHLRHVQPRHRTRRQSLRRRCRDRRGPARARQGQDLAAASEPPRERGWLRAAVPPALAADPAAAFTVAIIEVFFETLHASYPDDAWLALRRGVGTQLCAALEAERQSVVRSPEGTTREQLIECSRLTSVLPFQIIETLACGAETPREPSAGTRLGEAMWRIDDLVDLCEDAHSGSLNGVLLAATPDAGRRGGRDLPAVLERLLTSTDIASRPPRLPSGC